MPSMKEIIGGTIAGITLGLFTFGFVIGAAWAVAMR